METWYQAFGSDIWAVVVDKSTDNSVWIEGRRRKRRTDACAFFPAFEQAKEWLLKRAEVNAEIAQRRLTAANDRVSRIKSLTPR